MVFIMAFFDDTPHSIEELLSDAAVLRLLKILANNIPCITTGQANAFLHSGVVSGLGAHRLHKVVRNVLHKLEVAGYLGSESVKWLPPPTIGTVPLFRVKAAPRGPDQLLNTDGSVHTSADAPTTRIDWDGPDPKTRLTGIPTSEELFHVLEVIKRRVPRPDAHRPARFHFVTEAAHKLLDNAGDRESKRGFVDHASIARQIIAQHRESEYGNTPSPHDMSVTVLTKVANLTHLLLGDTLRPVIVGRELGEWDIEVNEYGHGHITTAAKLTKLIILEPLLPHQITSMLVRSLRFEDWEECWLM